MMKQGLQMNWFCRLLMVVLFVPTSTDLYAQDGSDSEDQLIVEAIWALVDFNEEGVPTPLEAFHKASSKFPKSAKVAYWRGRFQAYSSDRVRVFNRLSDAVKELVQPQSDEEEALDPIQDGKLKAVRDYLDTIALELDERIQELAAAGQIEERFETSLLEAVKLDPSLVVAWAGLLNSRDKEIALAAAEAWAKLEPNNALPLYAKAIVLTRDVNHGDAIDIRAIEALETGASRSDCKAPNEPWPTNFTLHFPDTLLPEFADLEGELISPQMFRNIVEHAFNRSNRWVLATRFQQLQFGSLGV